MNVPTKIEPQTNEQAKTAPAEHSTAVETLQDAPPVGERIHLPDPSIIPFLNAAGISVAIIGIPISLKVIIPGLILFAITGLIWIRDARREYNELPLDSEHH